MSEAVALLRRSTETKQDTLDLHSPEIEAKNREALLLVRKLLRDSVVMPVNEIVLHRLYQPELIA
ncbi:hypothetical protein PA10_00042 [Pseudomonas phage pPa_SNUABM_DT01]|nr:hypothetical protein PA10_00042 [Pseudomonas phage pPa_SNUABM_DT01]